MRIFALTLPPLTLILLLAFLWFVLLALLLGIWLRPRRPEEPLPKREVRRQKPAPEELEDDFPAQLPRPQLVREKPSSKGEDAFADFDPKARRDDFDF